MFQRIFLACAGLGLTIMAGCGGQGPSLEGDAADSADANLPGSDGSSFDGGPDALVNDGGRDASGRDSGRDAVADGASGDSGGDGAAWDSGDGALSDAGQDAGDGGDGAPVPPGAPGDWILVDAGTFTMGSLAEEVGRRDDETPHLVTLTHDYWMMASEITQVDFEAAMDYNPSSFPWGGDFPVENANWHEFAAYANKLSELEDVDQCYDCSGSIADRDCALRVDLSSPYSCSGYRLPTEAEWEVAARAGTTTATYAGDLDRTDCGWSEILNPIAWYCHNSDESTQAVAQKEPNPWGFFDLLGNVAEWCHDRFGDYPSVPVSDPVGPASVSHPDRLVRGGDWDSSPSNVRAARRRQFDPRFRSANFGARLVVIAR